jgi:ankyrin repeat protein
MMNESTLFWPSTPSIAGLPSIDGVPFPFTQISHSVSPNVYMSNIAFQYPHAFSWTTALDWIWMKTLVKNTGVLIKYPEALSMKLKALSYEATPIHAICATPDTEANFVQYLVSTLLNNVQTSASLKPDNMYSWLGRLPQSVILRFLKVLPPGHSDVLRERIFVAAMSERDVATIKSVLKTGFDLNQAIDFGASNGPELPLFRTARHCDYPIARTIVTHASLIYPSHELDDFLAQLVRGFEAHHGIYHAWHTPEMCSAFKWSELLRILIEAGARPTTKCLKVAIGDDVELVRLILEHLEEGVQGWIEAKVLQDCFQWQSRSVPRVDVASLRDFSPNPHIRLIFSYFMQEKLDEIRIYSPGGVITMREAFRSAINKRCTWAIGMMLAPASNLSIDLGDNLAHDEVFNASIIAAHRDSDWTWLDALVNQVNQVKPPGNQEPVEEELPDAERHARRRPNEHANLAYESLITDWELLLQRLNNYELSFNFRPIKKHEILHLLASGCSPEYDNILVALVLKLDRANDLHIHGLLNLLKRARVTAVSGIVSKRDHWNHALRCNRSQHQFDVLDDVLFRQHQNEDSKFYRDLHDLGGSLRGHGLELRVLSYHAIDTSDDMLLRWLLQAGLSTGEYNAGVNDGKLPSLLAVAASHNNAYMTQTLLNEGAESKDPDALLRAVAKNADDTVIETLLSAVGNVQCKKRYGGAALRMAIHRKNYDMLRLLSKRVDVDSIEPVAVEQPDGMISNLFPMSPMGQAIILHQDLEAAEILINNGANVNGVTTLDYDKYELPNARGTVMKRATCLLAAIDTGSMPMVRLLVERGANVNHSFRIGLIRTPLQWAAEIGNFDMVQYLLERGAYADSAPCYSGGTPLQLTAIGGYVGIAELLLEHGADLDHLPAEGNGRTAFEGAAEWGRVDMMSLLVSRGLNFDMVVNEQGHTQYHRAMEFAEKRGYMASKRFVQHLREELVVDSINWSAVMGG